LATLDFPQRVAVMSRFARFCARQLGQPAQRGSRIPLSRTAARVLAELAERRHTTPTALGTELGLDPGYLSRLLRALRTRHFVTREPSPANRRQSVLSLTRLGQHAAAKLDEGARQDSGDRLRLLSEDDQQRLVSAMRTIETLLDPGVERPTPYLLRPPSAGDMGWVVQRHAALYARESGWDARYEAKVAEFVAWFLTQHDPARECCWIAERDDENVGSVFLVNESPAVGRIRLLLVDPKARRSGIGTRLLRQCVGFARRTGYERVVLSARTTQGTTRHLYDALGFRLLREEWEQTSGRPVVGQTWELILEGSAGAA
jgi:DNA-binding MarR family transcriptional regulator/ribosomal protein S18 acetylase RimI-like enzyme